MSSLLHPTLHAAISAADETLSIDRHTEADAETTTHRANSVRASSHHQFDWANGRFYSAGAPLWIRFTLQFLVALLMTAAPPILTYMKLVPGAYPLLSLAPPVQPNAVVEGLRAVWLLGLGALVYVGAESALCLLAWGTWAYGHVEGKDVSETVAHKIEQTLSIRQNFGYAWMGAAMAVFSRVLYPQPVVVVRTATKATGEVIAEFVSTVEEYVSRSPQFFVANSCLAFAIIMGALLCERLLIKTIAHRFHSTGLSERIESNRFARKITKAIRRHALQGTKPNAQLRAKSGQVIFDHFHKHTLSVGDFATLMDDELARRYFGLLDQEMLGALNRAQFLEAVERLYEEQAAIDRTFLDQCCIIDKLNSLLMVIVGLVSFFAAMLVMDMPVRFLLTVVIAIVGSTAYIVHGMAKSAFDSIVFIIFTHPFDYGDLVIIGEHTYRVQELGLWTSAYNSTGGQLVYIANKTLINTPIVNLRRSPVMDESVQLMVLPSTSAAKIKELEALMVAWLKENEREYVPKLTITGFRITDREHMQLKLSICHRANFQDMERKNMRARKYMLQLKELIAALGIELSPPLLPK